ncbi:hypothetical protein [Sphingomonas sp. TREG-RG-20F-R18-01]|uniref:hypothetical protein n=1 Tax=Sphingomonas sp. TREG-RG-20F-R18-01 TaxID=2914982 RepID=UPI001F55CDE0|nr:hypothetical protein [Sphingomonas sp. TREG-RG-20F-R18-01]
MTEYYVVYDTTTGEVRLSGAGSAGATANQVVPSGAAVLQVPFEAVSGTGLDLAPIREGLIGKVNDDAGQFRLHFITDVAGQQATYLAKEEEAKAWTPQANLSDFPFLAAEAEYTGMAIVDIVTLVLATAAAWRRLAAKIEGRRRGAMVELAAAANVAALVRAATVDWAALAAPAAQ